MLAAGCAVTACWQPLTGAPPGDAATEVGAPDAATRRLRFSGTVQVTARMETLNYPTVVSLVIDGARVSGAFSMGSVYAGTITGSVSGRTLTLAWVLATPCTGGDLSGTAELSTDQQRLVGTVRGGAMCTVPLVGNFDLVASAM